MSRAVSFEQFDEACRHDWEWTHGNSNSRESWLAADMVGVRTRVHERMRNTLRILGVEVAWCENCDRCTWNPGPDCNAEPPHPHCERCGHCIGQHVQPALPDCVWEPA